MKKSLIVLLVLAFCIPAMAATVVVTDNGDATATIVVTREGTENIVGLGLDIDVTAGGNITAASVDAASIAAGFDIHMDAAYDDAGAYVYGTGTAIADQTAAGEAVVSNSFAISVGAMNGVATAGADGAASVSITIDVDGDTTIEVKENSLRGGIVLADGTGEDITSGTAGVVSADIVTGPPSCDSVLAAGDAGRYAAYLEAGSPDCWCEVRQCKGNADGLMQGTLKTGFYSVGTGDLSVLLGAWMVTEPAKGPGIASVPDVAGVMAACANFDNANGGGKQGTLKTGFYHVGTGDLTILLANWMVTEPTKGPGVAADCLPGLN